MFTDDLLPTNTQARHIMVALRVLQLAGINATINIQPEGDPALSIGLTSDPAGGSADLRLGIRIALEHEWQAASAALAVIQAKRGRSS